MTDLSKLPECFRNVHYQLLGTAVSASDYEKLRAYAAEQQEGRRAAVDVLRKVNGMIGQESYLAGSPLGKAIRAIIAEEDADA